MEKLKALLLHHDPDVRTGLREALRGADFLRVLGEAVSAYEALELLEAIPYAVIFLGVDLPGEVSGMELAQMLHGRKTGPALVFLAADESLAYKAFELEALDYLLWPPDPSRLTRTFDRLRSLRHGIRDGLGGVGTMNDGRRSRGQAGLGLLQDAGAFGEVDDDLDLPGTYGEGPDNSEGEALVSVPLQEEDEERFISALRQAWDHTRKATRPERPEIDKLAVSQDGRMMLVPFNQIVLVEAYEDYSYVHTASQKFLTSYRLKNLEKRLGPHGFFRVHRKFLVNLEMVTEIVAAPGSSFLLRTAGKTRLELPVSRRRLTELKAVLGL